MVNSGENRNPNSNIGCTSKYDRKLQKTVGLRLDHEVLEKFTEISKKKNISKQLILEGLLKEYIEKELGGNDNE